MRGIDLLRHLLLNPASVHPTSASWRVRFRFAAGEPKVDGTRTPPMEKLIQMTNYLFERCLNNLLRQRRQQFGNLSLQMRVS